MTFLNFFFVILCMSYDVFFSPASFTAYVYSFSADRNLADCSYAVNVTISLT